MLRLEDFSAIYLYREFVDFRKSINGLSEIVENEMALSPFSPLLFVFCNKRRDKLKILYWDHSGFALWYKRLEKEKFPWPKKIYEKDVVELDEQNFRLFLKGIDIWTLKPHQTLSFKYVS